jgi:Ricin-type beta-trefoil lectin domain/Ricin-type beta-trefoil lectin domain-like
LAPALPPQEEVTRMRYVLAITLLGLLTWAIPINAQGVMPDPLTVEIRTMDACLDVPGGDPADHVPLQIYPCHGGANQRWTLRSDFAGFVIIQSQSTNKCLDVPGGRTGVQQYRCHGDDNQRWRLLHDPDTFRFRIQPKQARERDSCIQVGDDRRLTTSRCDPTVGAGPLNPDRWMHQAFEIVVHPQPGFDIVINEDRQWCLDVAGFGQDDGALIQHHPCNRGPNQLWRLARQANGFVTIQAQHSQKCLKWQSGTGRRGVAQTACVSGRDDQEWQVQLASNGRVHLLPKKPVCLLPPSSGFPRPRSMCECLNAPSDGNVLHVESCSTSADQWRLGTGQPVSGALTFYQDNDVQGRPLCGVLPATAEYNFTRYRPCENDEARSLLIANVRGGTVIEVFDDSRCRTTDDRTRITVKRNVARHQVDSFEIGTEDDFVRVERLTRGNLDGKVSCVRIAAP